MRCVAYIRVSTKEQDEEVQRRGLEEFARARGIEVLKWFVDKGESGAKPFRERPSASQLLEELGSLKPECILVWAIDRLGRGMLDTVSTILMLESRGVKVFSKKEEFLQMLDPNIRKLILSIFAWVAEFERQRIRERQEEAWRQGKQRGRPPKVPLETIKQYLKRYPNLELKSIWKIMKADGYNISYRTLLQKLKMLRQQESRQTSSV
jgi:DNA invertase Pin-like site-specific DNA recombinase